MMLCGVGLENDNFEYLAKKLEERAPVSLLTLSCAALMMVMF
jgi:hypothetical protein